MDGGVVEEGKPLAVSMMELKMDAKAEGKELNYAGLQILKDIDGLFVKQEWEILEQISSFYEQKNLYNVFDGDGKVKLFKAKETTSCCWRVCCKQDRPYRMKVSDLTGTKSKAAMVFKRKYRCCGWAVIPCCAHRVDVHYMVDENNNTIGKESSRTLISKVQVPYCHGGCCFPTWHVQDRYGKTQSTITGPFCCVCDLCGASFTVTNNEGVKTGSIRKLAPDSIKGLALEFVTEADTFKLTFDKELDPTIKMAILAATLQIDFTFFEDPRSCCEGRYCDFYICGTTCPCLPTCCTCSCCCGKKNEKKRAQDRKGAPASEEMLR